MTQWCGLIMQSKELGSVTVRKRSSSIATQAAVNVCGEPSFFVNLFVQEWNECTNEFTKKTCNHKRQPVLSHDARTRARALSFCNPVSANHARLPVYKQSGQN